MYVEGQQPDVELGNTQDTRGPCIWFAQGSVSELRRGRNLSLHLPTMPASEPFSEASSIQEKMSIPMPLAISDGHDAAAAESFSTGTCSTSGADGPTTGEGMAPAEEQGDGYQGVAVAKGGLEGQVFPVEMSSRVRREGLGWE